MGTIEVQKICIEFEKKSVLKQLDLQVAQGEFMVVLGESGSGKSTFLNLIAGLATPSSGRILFDGQDITLQDVQHRNVAFVFQDYALYPHMTVEQNIRFPLENLKWTKRDIEQKCSEILELLKLENERNKFPAQLSGGQKQRVAMGRALVRDPFVFLFDEPLSSLDPHLRDHLRLELKQLHRELKKTFIYVTHDQLSAMVLGDRIAFLDDGKIQQVGSPEELYRAPANVRVARFFGHPPINILTASQYQQMSGEPAPDTKVQIGIRPENLQWQPDPKSPFEIQWTQTLGSSHYAYVKVGTETVCGLCLAPSGREKVKVSCRFNKDDLIFLDE